MSDSSTMHPKQQLAQRVLEELRKQGPSGVLVRELARRVGAAEVSDVESDEYSLDQVVRSLQAFGLAHRHRSTVKITDLGSMRMTR